MHACWPSPIVVEVSIISQLLATGGVWVIIGYNPVMRGVMGQRTSCSTLIAWGAFDHASHAPQLRSCNYDLCELIFF